jgi:hypothetical protein
MKKKKKKSSCRWFEELLNVLSGGSKEKSRTLTAVIETQLGHDPSISQTHRKRLRCFVHP